MEFQVSVADVRSGTNAVEIDCFVSAEPGHRVSDLIEALEPLFPRGNWSSAGPRGGTGRRWDGWGGSGGARATASAGSGANGNWANFGLANVNRGHGNGTSGNAAWHGWGAGGSGSPGGASPSAGGGASPSGGASPWGGAARGSAAPPGSGSPSAAPSPWGAAARGGASFQGGGSPSGVGARRLWLDDRALDPTATLAGTGIREGARLGLGGPAPGAGTGRPGRIGGGAGSPWGNTGPQAPGGVATRPDPGNPFVLIVNKQVRSEPSMPAPVTVDGATPLRDAEQLPPIQWMNVVIGGVTALVVTGGGSLAVTHQVGPTLAIGVVGSLLSSLGMLLPQLVNRHKAKVKARAQVQAVAGAANTLRERIGAAVAAEEQLLREALPDPGAVVTAAIETGPRLWERSAGEPDFMRLRLGTADQPSRTVIVQGTGPVATLSNPWAVLAGTPGLGAAASNAVQGAPGSPAISDTPMVRDVPVVADLARLGIFGIVGQPSLGRDVLSWMVAQLAAAQGPGELRLVLLTDTPQAWRWARWLPHLRPLDDAGGMLAVGTDPGSKAKRIAELRDLIARRRRGTEASSVFGGLSAGTPRTGTPGSGGRSPAIVLVIDGTRAVRDLDGIDDVLQGGPAVGVHVICRDDHRAEVPQACAGLLELSGLEAPAAYWERGRPAAEQVTRLDRLGNWPAEDFGRTLAPLRDRVTERETRGSGTVRLNDLWGYDRMSPAVVEQLWDKRRGSTKVPIGRLTDGSMFVLDIAKQGPHMLVAGATGSGKSEFLQTFIASLAVANPPDALNFVLIDYKGGAAFDGCRPLPHVTGFLTDLDEHLAQRVIASLRAETRYREGILADAHVPDIESYRAAGSPQGPLPRLLLVADEFRFLALEMPEALKELTDVTARGRSLGVHLVLATQRPGGVVTADMQANTSLRVCLRVEDPQDSTAVIDVPNAASIPKQARGRGFTRTERSSVTEFQGAYVGGPANGPGAAATAVVKVSARPFETAGVAPLSRDSGVLSISVARGAIATGPTDLSVLVEAVTATRRQAPEHRAWLDPLPTELSLAELPVARSDGGALPPVPYGMADLPSQQLQVPLTFDLERGSHLLIGGAPQSGRTTALRTITVQLAERYSPSDVHIYALDCDAGVLAPLERLPHCGAVVRRTEADRAGRLLERLDAEVSRRKDVLSAAGFASVTEQRRVGATAERLPYIVLLLDQWETFSADLGQIENARLATTLNRLISEGASAGLRVVITGGLSALSRLASTVPQRIVLRLNSATDGITAGVPRGSLPRDAGPGRGVLLPEAQEVQLAFAGKDPSGTAQAAAVEELTSRSRQRYPAPLAAPFRVDQLPTKVSLAQASVMPGWPAAKPLHPGLGVGGDTLGWLGPDLERYPGFAIAGPPYSGRSTALVVLATALLQAGTEVIGIAPRQSPLRALEGQGGVLAMFKDADPDLRTLYELLEGATGGLAVLVDDAEELIGKSADELLSQIPREGRGRGQALVIAGSPADLIRGSRNLTAAARSYSCGLLLTPQDTQVPLQLFNVRMSRSALFDRPTGRGYLVQPGQSVLIQVPEVAGA